MGYRVGLLAIAVAAHVHAQGPAATPPAGSAPPASAGAPQLPGACAAPDLAAIAPAERDTHQRQYLMCLEEQARMSRALTESLARPPLGAGSAGDPGRAVERGYSGGGYGAPYGAPGGGYSGGYSGGAGSSGGGYSTDTLRR